MIIGVTRLKMNLFTRFNIHNIYDKNQYTHLISRLGSEVEGPNKIGIPG